jgi:hypothetical protein
MKLAFTLSLVLISLFTFSDKSFALTDYQIKKICKKEKKGLKERELNCIKNLIEKRSNLQKGNLIEIPVIPFKN